MYVPRAHLRKGALKIPLLLLLLLDTYTQH